MSANSVSPSPNGEGGGSATACSMPSTTGTGMYDASVCHSRLPRLSSRRRSSRRADPVVLVEVRDVADLRDREPPPSRPRADAADLQRAEAGGEIAQLGVGQALVAEHQHRIAVDRRQMASTVAASSGRARSTPAISAPNAGLSAEISIDIAGSTVCCWTEFVAVRDGGWIR